ncbi:MAG: carbohydrate binding domain-containing protein [Victivallaceae bacterium]|jgi:hypothetical protein
MKIFCFLLLLFVSGYGLAEAAFPIDMEVSANPSLPLENILRSGDFEQGLSPWRTAAKDEIGLSEENVHNGKFSLRVNLEKKARIPTRSYYCLAGDLKRPLKPGQAYIISGWMNGSDISSNGGGLHHGAGFLLSIYDQSWKKSVCYRALTYGHGHWVYLVSEPFTLPEWAVNVEFHAGIFYTYGTVFFDDIYLAEAYTKLYFHVKSHKLLQVTVEDETGHLVFNSGELPEKTDEFSKSIDVLSPYRYSIKAINRNGTTVEKFYPSLDKN